MHSTQVTQRTKDFREPRNRGYEEVVTMLLERIERFPTILLCKNCRGEHVVADKALTLHCMCGTVTRYAPWILFFTWCSLAWNDTLRLGGDTIAIRTHKLHAATIVDEPLVNPRHPIDTRVALWRMRL